MHLKLVNQVPGLHLENKELNQSLGKNLLGKDIFFLEALNLIWNVSAIANSAGWKTEHKEPFILLICHGL